MQPSNKFNSTFLSYTILLTYESKIGTIGLSKYNQDNDNYNLLTSYYFAWIVKDRIRLLTTHYNPYLEPGLNKE